MRPTIQIAPGVVLVDVSAELPRRRRVPPSRNAPIERIYVHHSGRLGAPGFAGLHNSAIYVVRRRKRKFPTVAYHYWIPHAPVWLPRDDGAMPDLVIYRAAPDAWRTWHTGGVANNHGIGVALQGNTTTNGLSDAQIEALEALLPWLRERHATTLDADWLSWHAEADRFGGRRKPSCPGAGAVEWLSAYRALA